MKKPVIVMLALLSGVAWQTAAHDVEAIIYLSTEMPCLKEFETLSGRIVIRNNGNGDIKLLKGAMLVTDQLYLFPNIPVEEEKIMAGVSGLIGLGGIPSRQAIKEDIDYDVQKNECTITLKKGESLEAHFDRREIKARALNGTSERIPIAAELYLSPDTWIPVEVHPQISVACDAKYTPLIVEEGHRRDRDAAWVSRVKIGTNEFLFAKQRSDSYRLADLRPDDVVTHTDNTITITRKDGNVRTIPEKDIPRISAERKEEKRKNRPKE